MTCPVCHWFFVEEEPRQEGYRTLACRYCGRYHITDTAVRVLEALFSEYPYGSAALAHWLRASSRGPDVPTLTESVATKVVRDTPSPSPVRQAENLILWLGQEQRVPGPPVDVDPMLGTIVAGAPTFESFDLVMRHLFDDGYVEGERPSMEKPNGRLALSFKGWQRHEDLLRGTTDSLVIFMAMKFGDKQLDKMFNSAVPAVKKAGFDLIRIDKRPKAGLIDDSIRVEIRRSAMIIADLTHNNPGAYWESGLAEGIRKPVLFTCEEAFFMKKPPYKAVGGTHFDTNHFYTVIWREDNLLGFQDALKAAVRATLPDLAKLVDD